MTKWKQKNTLLSTVYSGKHLSKVPDTFLWDYAAYGHNCITQLVQICQIHIHNANLSLQHVPKLLYCAEQQWPWRLLEWSELIVKEAECEMIIRHY